MVYLQDYIVSETWNTNVASLCVASVRIQGSIAYFQNVKLRVSATTSSHYVRALQLHLLLIR